MLFANSLEKTAFPVRKALRNPSMSVTVTEDGAVYLTNPAGQSRPVVSAERGNAGFRTFHEFWAVVFASNCHAQLGLNQLIYDLANGRIAQDPHCPYLFFDKTRAFTVDGQTAWPVMQVNQLGLVAPYNPDWYVNEVFVLADHPQFKLYGLIEDCDGNDILAGFVVGTSAEPGKLPEFNPVAEGLGIDAIQRAVASRRRRAA